MSTLCCLGRQCPAPMIDRGKETSRFKKMMMMMHYLGLMLLILYVAIQVTGHIVSMELLNVLGLVTFADQMLELVRRLKELNLDINECVCLKFVILLNPG